MHVDIYQPRVLADMVVSRRAHDVMVVLASALVVGASAQVVIPLPFTPVPLTLQTLAVLVVGAAAGPVRAVAALALYVAVGVAGMPWFAGGGSGVGGATFGYVLGFVAAGAVVGALAQRGRDRTFVRTVGLMVVGNLVIYSVGVTWLAVVSSVRPARALELGLLPFVPGDTVKIAVAAAALPAAWRLLGAGARQGAALK
ncbi:biotin biosynthesis protein BioY [Actinomycetospora sp. NBRC 106375]|uniref:biotin transporter BioY n=1 Tax=Actinomycetospora sp. NBRC 106375 TaxID=3032207 RepID=UPI0024A0C33E|nr:biotin transporter BioY [Actinomycetospora sp. NBRC 106375]GLZ50247.1 biotin biosynthesis protein BioY [Actinomycetospora sp. NBRC 106375]